MERFDPQFAVYIVLGFFVFFALMWSGVVTLIAYIGGWRRIAADFPFSTTSFVGEVKKKATMCSLRISVFGRYNNCVTIIAYDRGIALKQLLIFKISHPDIFIPWDSIKNVSEINYFWYKGLRIQAGNHYIDVYGRATEFVREQLQRRK